MRGEGVLRLPKPKLFRDPVYDQIRFEQIEKGCLLGSVSTLREKLSWLIQKLVDTPEFQRLRRIRQNGLAFLVFQGMEHSRFCHSMGAVHIAIQMYENVCRNMGCQFDEQTFLALGCAALLHDVGHGPFSHAFEDVLDEAGVAFEHERVVERLILEDTRINEILCMVDTEFPQEVVAFISDDCRSEERWEYRLVSSQLDCDRLDYMMRDPKMAGLKGYSFDLSRLLEMLVAHDGDKIGVLGGAIVAVESFLVSLDQIYHSVYFHKAVRSASVMLNKVIARAMYLYKGLDKSVFSLLGDEEANPLLDLLTNGHDCNLERYCRLNDYHIWVMIDSWQDHEDPVLSRLSRGIVNRDLFKSCQISIGSMKEQLGHIGSAKECVKRALSVGDEDVDYYFEIDEPTRTTYKTYNFGPDTMTKSIWVQRNNGDMVPIESFEEREIISSLKNKRRYPRLILPAEAKDVYLGLDGEVAK